MTTSTKMILTHSQAAQFFLVPDSPLQHQSEASAPISSMSCPRQKSHVASAIPQAPFASSVISSDTIWSNALASFPPRNGARAPLLPATGFATGSSPCANKTCPSTTSNANWLPVDTPSVSIPSPLSCTKRASHAYHVASMTNDPPPSDPSRLPRQISASWTWLHAPSTPVSVACSSSCH